jgi:quercetin dioxygenase-like cupin family protein
LFGREPWGSVAGAVNDDPAPGIRTADEHARVIVVAPGDGQTVANPAGGGLTYKARSGQTGGALTAWESTAAPGEGPPLHLHVNEDELMYVLEGRLRFRLGETDHSAPAGSCVFIPRGVSHAWQNAGAGRARILFVFTPASPALERFFERSAELPEDTRMAAAFKTLASDAGMEVVGPPLAPI